MQKRWVEEEDDKKGGLDLMYRPSVMTVLAVGSELYFTSSLKGGAFVLYSKDDQNP
jgi:hypothetical protein